MSPKLLLAARVVGRRLEAGEAPEAIWADYPRLTQAERAEILAFLGRGS